jgi:hypothetical protein
MTLRAPTGGVSLSVRPLQAPDAPAADLDGLRIFAREGAPTLALRLDERGVEDFVLFPEQPRAGEQLTYELTLGPEARALRLVDRILEVLDRDGVPRIRMESPYVLGADGVKRPVEVRVEGCQVDRSAAAPWRRPLVEPGSERCELVLTWSGVRYPAAVDPAWKPTQDMLFPRESLAMGLLSTGDVLVAGGNGTPTAELFKVPAEGDYDDPGAFAATGGIPGGDLKHAAMAPLAQGRALLHGGATMDGFFKESSWLYDAATGAWTAAPTFSPNMAGHQLVPLPDGRWLVAGGESDVGKTGRTAIYDPKAGPLGAWSLRSSLPEKRQRHAVAATKDGKVVVVGGENNGPLDSTWIYDVATDQWSPGPSLDLPRQSPAASALPDGRVLVTGGIFDDGVSLKAVVAIDPVKKTIDKLADLATFRSAHRTVVLADGRVLLSSGSGFVTWLPSAELYDPLASSTPPAPAGATRSFETIPRRNHALVWLGGTRALVAGGDSNFSVVSSAELFQLRPPGAPCSEEEECASRHCVDGVCCQEACDQECEACSQLARGGGPPDGVCAARSAGVDARAVDNPSCADATNINPCGTNGRCNGLARSGAAACQLQVAGVRCTDQLCQAPSFVLNVCDGQGACVLKPCAPYARCASEDACATSCLLSSDCIEGFFCTSAGACVEQLVQGASCSADSACKSGFCVDGVCCDSPCEGPCRACSAAAKGAGPDGVCAPVAAGLPSSGDCVEESPETCGRTGACDGQGACALHGIEASCGAGSVCGQQPDGSSAVFSFRCSTGTCVPRLEQGCGLYACGGTSCRSDCGADADCAPEAFCSAGLCVGRKTDGQPCSEAAECSSGVCAEGICCNVACDGICESCSQPGSQGTCVAISGLPAESRGSCEEGPAGNVCGARRCDGVEREICAGFVGPEQPCAAAVCKIGEPVLLLAASCAGNGLCQTQEEAPCRPYGCAEGACRTSCAGDGDCAPNARCEGQQCVTSARCEDASTLLQVDGSRVACAPFRCDDQARSCLGRCFSTADCSAGNSCTSEGRCAPPLASTSAEVGCSTSPTRRRAGGAWAWALGAAVLGALRRRRRLAALALGLVGCSPAEDPATETPPGAGVALDRIEHAFQATPALLQRRGEEAPGWLRLPPGADGAVELREPRSGMQIAFRLEGAAAAPPREERGIRAYEGALGPGSALLLRPTADGVEDLVFLERGGRSELRYRVDLGAEVAGLRCVDRVVEFLDPQGAPRLRVAAPTLERPGARPAPIDMTIEGCACDADPAPPWGRPPGDPGARSCTLRLGWSPSGGPELIDPAWQSTGNMSDPRALHTAIKLKDGRVLVAGGGNNFDDGQIFSAEVYDPTTGTWAKTGTMNAGRSGHGAWLLDDGRVLVGSGLTLTDETRHTTEIYDPATGQWTLTGELSTYRYSQTNGVLPDGRPFVAGGYRPNPDTFYNDAFAYDVGTGQWTKLPGTMVDRRRYGYSFPLPGGRVLVASGKINTTASNEVVTDKTEIYDPVAGVWSAGPKMKRARQFPAMAMTPQGILFAGGIGVGFPPVLNSTELFRFTDEQFVELTPMTKARTFGAAVWLPQEERVLVTGGADAIGTQKSTELLALTGSPALSAGDMAQERGAHTITLLNNGVVLVAGGGKAALGKLGFPSTGAELFSTLQIGQPCQSSGQCPQVDPLNPGSRYCVDGVCCDSPCNGLCRACSGKKTGGTDGTCKLIAAGLDPDGECPQDPAGSCGRTGVCDGQGACALTPDGTICASSCESDLVTLGVCDKAQCTLSSAPCGLFLCDKDAGVCRTSCAVSGHCASSAFCDLSTGTCAPRRGAGEPCDSWTACQSGQCVDGVCCETPCSGACNACRADLQDPSASPKSGTCLPARLGAPDPRGACEDLPCVSRTTCDGTGKCQGYIEGDACSSPKCVGDDVLGFRVARFACQQGLCKPAADLEDCGLFACNEGVCETSCDQPEDCTARAYCGPQQQCLPGRPLGEPCASADQCASGFCVDGVCCNSACEGPCGQCNAADQPGRCIPTATPSPERPPCPQAPEGDPCQQRRCDGLAVNACEGFVGTTTVCVAGGCSEGRERSVARCDGRGTCGAPVERACLPYACGEGACRSDCRSDADCAPGNRCVDGSCAALLACDPARGLLRDSTGALAKECGLYSCSPLDGSCLIACRSTAECVGGAVCTSRQTCELPPRPAGSSAGCGCSLAPVAPPRGLLLASLASLLLLGSRRLRRLPRP